MSASAPVLDISDKTKRDSAAAESPEQTRQRYERACARLRDYKDSRHKNRSDIAKELGPQPGTSKDWADGTIGSFLAGTYPIESVATILAAVERLLARVEEVDRFIVQPDFVRTSVAKRVFALIKRVKLFCKIGILAADPGVGKSFALNEWQHTIQTSILLRANGTWCPASYKHRSYSSPWPTLAAIAKELKIETNRGAAPAVIYDAIVQRLSKSGRVLLIDQAHFIPPEALEILASLNEDADLPIVLAGWPKLYEAGPREWDSIQAFRRRTIRDRITTRDIKPTDVDLIIEQIVDAKVARAARESLINEARKPGSLGWLVSLLQYAQTLTEGKVTAEHVEQAIREVPPVVIVGDIS